MKKLCILILSLVSAVSAFAQTKTVTNADLEKFRQQRLKAEKDLRERYAEMGFPSPEEREEENARQQAELEEYSNQLRQQRLESQNDIITQANELRSEIASIDGQLDYLRGLIGGKTYKGGTLSTPLAYSLGGATYGGTRGFRGGRTPLQQLKRLPPNMGIAQGYALLYPSSQSIYQQNTGSVRLGGRFGYGRRGYYGGATIAPVIVNDFYGVDDVRAQIVNLEQQRAGLLAEWQILAERARRAGIRLD